MGHEKHSIFKKNNKRTFQKKHNSIKEVIVTEKSPFNEYKEQ